MRKCTTVEERGHQSVICGWSPHACGPSDVNIFSDGFRHSGPLLENSLKTYLLCDQLRQSLLELFSCGQWDHSTDW